jgi:hypothetical protein
LAIETIYKTKKSNYLVDLLDLVATSKNEGGDRRGSESRGSGETLLVHVGLLVPFSPGLGWSKHASTTTHVSESTLTGTVSTSSRHTRNTSNSTTLLHYNFNIHLTNILSFLTSSPRHSRGLVTSLNIDSVSLSLVLGHVGVHKVDDIGTDGGSEDCGESNGAHDRVVTGLGKDGNHRTSSLILLTI